MAGAEGGHSIRSPSESGNSSFGGLTNRVTPHGGAAPGGLTWAFLLLLLVLLLLFVAGASVRHAMIGRGSSSRWALLPAALALAGAMFLSTPGGAAARTPAIAGDSVPPFHAVRAVIAQRCQPCHSQYQSDRTFGPAPGGVTLDTPEAIARYAERIRVRAVETKTMPLANKTGITEDERALLGRWIAAGAPLR